MRTFLGLITLVLISNISFASNVTDPKINTLKKMYAADNLEKFSTSDFRGILNTAPIGAEVGCIDWSPSIQGQDTVNFKVLNYKVINSKTVNARITNGGQQSTVTYKMACNGNSCLINDIIEPDGISIRNKVKKCLS